MLILAFSCLAATRSYSMFALMSARMIGALAHGAFWALIGIVAAQLVPPHRLGLATAIIFGGVSAASVVGCRWRALSPPWRAGDSRLCRWPCCH